jgi:carbonic anhydrase
MSPKIPRPTSGVFAAPRPVEFTFRYDPAAPREFFVPKSWEAAVEELRNGNEKVARFIAACQLPGLGIETQVVELSRPQVELEPKGDDGFPKQMPFAVVVGCSDARVPAEILFGQEFNAIFNIRLAGSVLPPEAVGSLLYALKTFVPQAADPNLRGLKLVVALGHRGCGAVKATIRTCREDPSGAAIPDDPIGTILKRIHDPALIAGARAVDHVFGDGAAANPDLEPVMIELVVYLNAAWLGHQIRNWVWEQSEEAATQVGVVYGVFDPGDFRVRARPPDYEHRTSASFFAAPPRDRQELEQMAIEVAQGLHRALSGGPPRWDRHRAFFP